MEISIKLEELEDLKQKIIQKFELYYFSLSSEELSDLFDTWLITILNTERI